MASRYYPIAGAPSVVVHGGAKGSWGDRGFEDMPWNPVQTTHRMSTSKANPSTRATITASTNQQGNFGWYWHRWLTPPLAAQAIGGTFDLCFMVHAIWDDFVFGNTGLSDVRYKLHIYLAQGETATVRTVLLDNYVDSVTFPKPPGVASWRQLAAPQALAAATAVDGDVIVVEMGFSVVSSPTPVPTYPPTEHTRLTLRYTGAVTADADATGGAAALNLNPWMEFSQTLTELALPATPSNDTCATAINIASLPYQSGFIDTTGATGTANRGVWWTWTAPTAGRVFFHLRGTNYLAQISVFNGCGGANLFPAGDTNLFSSRSESMVWFDAVVGRTYAFRVAGVTTAEGTSVSGGACRFGGFYRELPAVDDLYLAGGGISAFREGQPVNFNPIWASNAPTGIGFDYTQRTMSQPFIGGNHTGERLLLGLHDASLVEVLDLPTLSIDTAEIDFFSAQASNEQVAQLHVSAAGMLYVGHFGNGYLYVVGTGGVASDPPAVLNTVSDIPQRSAVMEIDAIAADNQASPGTGIQHLPDVGGTAPWGITVDEASHILYYTTGSVYIPANGQTIKRWDLTNQVQLADFATLPASSGRVPSVRGLRFLQTGGGVLVANGDRVHWLDPSGSIIRTFTPSIPEDSQTLIDVDITTDGLYIWTVDLATTRFFKFDITTGAEVFTFQPYNASETLLQMGIYQPEPTIPPPSGMEIICVPTFPDIVVNSPSGGPVVVTYSGVPTIIGGTPPYTVTFNPVSGFAFPIGTTTVTVTVEDSLGALAFCEFLVTVLPPAAPAPGCPVPNPPLVVGDPACQAPILP